MNEASWLVKSSGRILGPFTLVDLCDLIRNRQISLLDEVKEPQTRWLFAREQKVLADVVKEIRDNQANSIENTQSTFVTSGRTVTSSVTERLFQESELTPKPKDEQGLQSVSGSERSVEVASVGGRSFGILTDKNVQKKMASSLSQWSLFLYAGVFVLAVGAVFIFKSKSKPSLSAEQGDSYFRDAQDLASRGDLTRSLSLLEKIEVSRALNGPESLLKIKILLSNDGASELEITRILEDLKLDTNNGFVNLDMVKGLIQSRLGRNREAMALFQKATSINVQQDELNLNLAANYFVGRDFNRALNHLRNLRGTRHHSYYNILKALIVLKWEDPKTRLQVQQQALDELKSQILLETKDKNRESIYELRFEQTLLLASLASRLGQMPLADEMKRKLVQMNPFESSSYVKSPLLDWSIVDWKELIEHCQTISQNSGDSAVIRGVQSLCLGASGNLVPARNSIDIARRQFPMDNFLLGVDALLLYQTGRKPEAERLAGSNQSQDSYLSSWVKAMACEDKLDFACVESTWERVKSMDPWEPRAYFGLAKVAKDLGNDPKFISSSSQGLRVAPNYRPLLQLTGAKYDF